MGADPCRLQDRWTHSNPGALKCRALCSQLEEKILSLSSGVSKTVTPSGLENAV